MRIGMNPFKGRALAHRSARVTVAVLVCIPHTKGYFAGRFEVLRLSIESILKHTPQPYDLMVMDNGSCPEVAAYLKSLQASGKLAYLMRSSRNIGKLCALRMIFGAAPGELVAYSDDDVFFRPGWLADHLSVLDAFPDVGMVSGSAIRAQFRYGNKCLPEYLIKHAHVTMDSGYFIPDEWEEDFCRSTGRDFSVYLKETSVYRDIRLHCRGVTAYATATHFQFLAPRLAMLEFLVQESPEHYMGRMVEMDERVDGRGLIRLATSERRVQHIGNRISSDDASLADKFGIGGWNQPNGTVDAKKSLSRRLRAWIDRVFVG